MGSSDLISEKFAMYFATMNPLASKIYADIEGIEDYLKSHGPPSLTYSEKCNIVDKFMIYDHLSLNKNDTSSHPHGKLSKRLTEYQKYNLHKSETSLNSLLDNDKEHGMISEAELLQPVFYNDSTLDQDHESVLLTSVAPKKPEKYVYDDNNYWIDEHSGVYSSCTETQAKACKLHQFLNSLPPPPQPKRGDHVPHKYRAPPIPSLCSKNSVEDEESSYIIKPSKKKSEPEVEEDGDDRYSKIDNLDRESKTSKKGSKYSVAVPVFGGLFGESAAPQQRRNSKQEVLEKDSNVDGDLPNQVQNKDLIAELQAKLKKGKQSSDSPGLGISPRSSAKVHKPKAPPPPPPGSCKAPGGAVKMAPSEKKADNDTKTSKKNPSGDKSSSSSDKKSEREISDDFVVDVSSPCKIVTPKTGLDFLDNW